ncbi:MAG TPA: hypothetical protein VMF06_17810 [Candidatus Limnocylindria bacterium]|nr:hypothetical protein [Candidatus Limnocylindria bacterium]
MLTDQELLLELCPRWQKLMPDDDSLKPAWIKLGGFNKLRQSRPVLASPSRQGNGGQMLHAKHRSDLGFDLVVYGFQQRLLDQAVGCGKKLHWPSTNTHVLAVHSKPLISQAIEQWLWICNPTTGLNPERDKNIDINRREGLQIEGCGDGASNCVSLDYPITPHPIQNGNDLFNAHPEKTIALSSRKIESRSAPKSITPSHLNNGTCSVCIRRLHSGPELFTQDNDRGSL